MTYATIMTVVGYAAMAIGAVVMAMTFMDTPEVTKATMQALAFSGAAMTLAGVSLVISVRKGG